MKGQLGPELQQRRGFTLYRFGAVEIPIGKCYIGSLVYISGVRHETRAMFLLTGEPPSSRKWTPKGGPPCAQRWLPTWDPRG